MGVAIVLAALLAVSVGAASGAATVVAGGSLGVEVCGGGAPHEVHEFADPTEPGARVVVETICVSEEAVSGGGSPGDDCTSDAYALASHHWASPYSAKVDPSGSGLGDAAVLAAFRAAGESWDGVTARDIFGTVSLGGDGSRAGSKDGVNQLGFRVIDEPNVLGRTTTWYSSGGRATESDGVYNSRATWTTTGASGAMDLQSVAAHEIGHTFGLSHPSSASSNECLTMYYSTRSGDTSDRTLGLGDVQGAQKLYGVPDAGSAAPFEATFRPKPGNAWWIEVEVDANAPVQGVSATVDGGAPVPLELRGWGAWAKSVHAPAGSVVRFTATDAEGRAGTSGGYVWPTAVPASSGALSATFAPGSANPWWVEVRVEADAPLAGVTAVVDGGAPVALELRSWGAWAKSFHVPDGSTVRFVATSDDGRSATSPDAYRWPDATPVGSFQPTFTKGGANNWWVEVRVDADRPLTGVSASVDGGAPVALELRSWGAWAKSFYVPSGATVRFTASATDGSSATSAAFRWP